MERSRLQVWILAIWVLGCVVLELCVWSAHTSEIDGFIVGDKVFIALREILSADPAWGVAEGTSPADRDRENQRERRARDLYQQLKQSVEADAPRTKQAFETLARATLVGSEFKANWVFKKVRHAAAQDRVAPLFWGLLQVYAPWLTIMLVGLFTDAVPKAQVSRPRVMAAIALSALLQVVFIAIVAATLFVADLANTEDPRSKAIFFSSMVGALVQFAFPKT